MAEKRSAWRNRITGSDQFRLNGYLSALHFFMAGLAEGYQVGKLVCAFPIAVERVRRDDVVNVQVSGYFRNSLANLTAPIIAQDCGAALFFPVGGIFPLSPHTGSERRVISSLNVFGAAINRAIKVLISAFSRRIDAHCLTATRADNIYLFVWFGLMELIKTGQRAKNMVALLLAWLHIELNFAVLASKCLDGSLRSSLFLMISRAVADTELIEPPALDGNLRIAISAFCYGWRVHTHVCYASLMTFLVISFAPVRKLLDGLSASTLADCLHRQIVHDYSLL